MSRHALEAFAAEVGDATAGPVCVRGGGTKWTIGGTPAGAVRELRAPHGIVAYEPAEMTVRVGAGTTIEELQAALAPHRQITVLAGPTGATVGGVLAVGWNGLRSTREGLLRDALLQATYVSAEGRVVVAGGPTVKNVTGYDLCRLLVGSLGTLGLLGEVILRTRPQPEVRRWLRGRADPFALRRLLYRPSAVLWDGETTWILLEGYAADVTAESDLCARHGLVECEAPPPMPPHRWSLAPSAVDRVTDDLAAGTFIAEVGVGIVHADRPAGIPAVDQSTRRLHEQLRAEFDPTHRLNPGRDPLARV